MASGQTVQLSIGGGLDLKTDPKKVRGPNALELMNVVFTKAGTYTARNGYDRHTTVDNNNNLLTPLAMATRQDELLLFDGKYGYSYDTASARFWRKGRITCLEATERPISETSSNQYSPDYADNGVLRLTAWVDSSDSLVHYCLENSVTGLRYVENTSVASSSKPRVLAVGDFLHLYYVEANGAGDDDTVDLKVFSLENTSGTTYTSVLTLPLDDVNVYDVCTNGEVALVAARVVNAGNNNIYCKYRLASGAAGAGGALEATTGTAAATTISVDFTATQIFVAWSIVGSTTVYCYSSNRTFGAIQTRSKGSVTADMVSVVADQDVADTASLFTTDQTSGDEYWQDTTACYPVTASAISAASWTMQHAGIAAHGFYYNGYRYIVLYFDSPLQSQYYLVSHDRYTIARSVVGTGEGRPTAITSLPRCSELAPGVWTFAGVSRERLQIDTSTNTSDTRSSYFADKNVRAVTYDFTSKKAYRFVEYGRSTYLLGGFLWCYDGSSFTEAGFLQYPEGKLTPAPEEQVEIGGTGAASDYHFRARFEWTNAQNERFRSATLGQTDTSAPTHTCTITTLAVTNRDVTQFGTISNNSIVLYGANAPDLDAGDPLYRLTSADPSTSASDNGWMNNSLTALTVARLVNSTCWTASTSQELDYGNVEYENWLPPAASLITAGNGRVFLAGCTDDVNRVYYSKTYVNNQGLAFAQEQNIQIPAEGGPITGLACLNEALLVFKEHSIYAVAGEGLNNSRSGQPFHTPNLLTSDTGCAVSGLTVRTPEGVMFVSPKGIYQVNQGYRVQYIGAAVERYNTETFTSAVCLQDQNQVRFLNAISGRTLVYDFTHNAWTTFAGVYGSSAVIWQNVYTFLRNASSMVYVETPGVFTDGGVLYDSRVRFAWYNPDGRQGYFRCKTISILGKYYTEHTLKVRLYYDYSDLSTEYTIASSAIATNTSFGEGGYGDGTYGGGDSVYIAQVWPARQKCFGLSIEIELQPAAAGSGFELSDIAMKVGQKHGPGKLAATKRIGS